MKNKILVVAAHPDDEVLGAGGMILKNVEAGSRVDILILGDGATSRGASISEIKKRAAQAWKATQILGAETVILEDLPDNKFDSVPLLEIVKKIEKAIAKIKPDIIYTHFGNDLNIDHRLTFQAVMTACRPQPGFCVKKISSFEILSSTEWQEKSPGGIFCPNEYEDINDFIDKKIEVLEKVYGNELRPYPHSRSIESVKTLARFRGLESGLEFAEAFCLIRKIT